MELEQYSIKQVVKWFIERTLQDSKPFPSYEKLQLYLYYTKGFSYLLCNECFFESTLIAVNNFPITKEFDSYMKTHNYKISLKLFQNEYPITNPVILEILNFVYDTLNKIDDHKLFELTNFEIFNLLRNNLSDKRLFNFFHSLYLNDNQINNLSITRKELLLKINKINLTKYEKAFWELAQ